LAKEPLTEPVRIVVADGTYRLTSPLFLRTEDSGTAASPTVIEAAPGARPVLSGGVVLEGWQKPQRPIPGLPAAARGKVWVSDPPKLEGRTIETRQLYVNGRKATRAKQPNGDDLPKLLEWDRDRHEAWIAADQARWQPAPGVEMVVHQQWEIANLRVKSVRVEGDRARITFYEPESRIQFEHPWPQPVMQETGNSPYYLVGAIEFLDSPGEWFQELPSGRIIYWPRPGERMPGVEAVAPALESLTKVVGTLDRPVEHVTFRGIGFEHATWLRPAKAGHVPLQAGRYLLDA
jgi:hypothetical protein